jgi:hypothetical protein
MADGQGEAAWGTSGQVTTGMMEHWNTGPGEIKKVLLGKNIGK